MTAFTRSTLEAERFTGFVSFHSILADRSIVPAESGVYVVLFDQRGPAFLDKSTGGWFKGLDPSIPAQMLESNWVPEASVLYVGKTNNLRRRLHEFARFGSGGPVGHRGGRLLWHLKDAPSFLVAGRPRRARTHGRSSMSTFTASRPSAAAGCHSRISCPERSRGQTVLPMTTE